MRQRARHRTPGQVERAARFHLQAAVRYRESGAATWYLGKIVNISRSGVLFRAEHDFAPDTRLEMNINLPVGMGGSQGLKVLCSGPIVRKDLSAGELALAARIQTYRLAPDQQADPR